MSTAHKSKEEILKNAYEHHRNVVKPDGNWATWESCIEDGTTDLCYQAMDEFAKQEVLRFAEWFSNCDYVLVNSEELKKDAWVNCKENEVLVNGSDWHYTKLIKEVGITTEELYQLYLNSKK